MFLQIIFVLNPEKISDSKITIPAYDDLIKYISGVILPSNKPGEIVDIEIVSIPTFQLV